MAMAAVEAGARVIRPEPGSCAFYVQRKKRFCCPFAINNSRTKFRFCKMSVKPGAQYCGEHSPIPITEQDLGRFQTFVGVDSSNHLKLTTPGNKPISELRVPCPYDPKHTCFASKMEKHLRICNSKVKLVHW